MNLVLFLVPHFTGSLSAIGSSTIIYMILSDRENKLLIPKHRLMLAMSIYDVFQSLALAMSTLPYPKEYFDVYSYGAIGNMTTCKIQYFFVTLGLAVPMYNASLCLLYYLTIRHRWRPRHFGTKIEPFLHTGACLIPLVAAIGPIVLDSVRPNLKFCALSVEPPNKSKYALFLIFAIPTLSLLICIYTMASISIFVHLQWQRMVKYTHNARQLQRQTSEKRKTILQAVLYTAAFVLTFIFPFIVILVWAMTETAPFIFNLLDNIFYPLQGFWNFFLYIRPSVIRMKKTTPNKHLCEIIWLVIFRSNGERLNNRHNIPSPRERIGSEGNNNETSKKSKNLNSGQVKATTIENEENDNERSGDNARQSVYSQTSLSIASNNPVLVSNYRNCDLDVASYTYRTEGASKVESGSDNESYGQSLRRSSLVFATALDEDDISED